MPTQTFFNLPKDKQERIIQGAMKEFSQLPFSEVSIAKIIQHADISRGSFYQYFEHKMDLYCYLIRRFKRNYHELMVAKFREHAGDFYAGYLAFSEYYIRAILESPKFGFFEQLYLNMNYQLNKQSIDILFENDKQEKLVDVVSVADLVVDQTEVEDVFEFLHKLLNQTIMEGFWQEWSIEQTNAQFKRQLDWLFDGLKNHSPQDKEKE